MMRDGRDLAELLQHAITVTAPHLHVPSHVRVKNGELSLVNYDHCFLAIRGSLRMMRYQERPWTHLPMAQAIWYLPQGLDVWTQLQGRFPGHYAYSAGFKEFPLHACVCRRLEDPEGAIHVQAPVINLVLSPPVDAMPGRHVQHQGAARRRSIKPDARLRIPLDERQPGKRLAVGRRFQIVHDQIVPCLLQP
jgi:hypothetical protein